LTCATAEDRQLCVDCGEVDGLAMHGVVVAAHAAHAALGVAGVGQVERGERLEPPRPAGARGAGGGVQRRGVERRRPQDREVVDVERRGGAGPRQGVVANIGPGGGRRGQPRLHVIGIECERDHRRLANPHPQSGQRL